MSKWLSSYKEKLIDNTQKERDIVDTFLSDLAMSTLSPCTLAISKKKSYITHFKEEELKELIRKCDKVYGDGGNEEAYVEAVISETLQEWGHDLDTAIQCYRDILKSKMKNRE